MAPVGPCRDDNLLWQCNGGDRQGGIENNERNKNIWDSNDPGKKELRSKVGCAPLQTERETPTRIPSNLDGK